jgi:hypothetical protein
MQRRFVFDVVSDPQIKKSLVPLNSWTSFARWAGGDACGPNNLQSEILNLQ